MAIKNKEVEHRTITSEIRKLTKAKAFWGPSIVLEESKEIY